MEKLKIHTQTGSYPIYVGSGLIAQLDELIPDKYSDCFIISDSHVAPLYLERVRKALGERRIDACIVPAGEQSKTLETYDKVITAMLEKKYDRTACVIALGGGVVGDLAGFVAATYMRGVAFVQVPTTLLAHDSSVGGKTGIDHPLGKNLIGAFYPPAAVVYDSDTLKTLPEREMRSGFAELIKHSLIDSAPFYKALKTEIPDRAALTADSVGHFLLRGIQVKAGIVERDEHERGQRMLLNFGHTLGHAIEKELGYGKMTHGEAVAVGMCFAIRMSEAFFNRSLPEKEIRQWFVKLGLPVRVPDELSVQRLIEQMRYDKKNRNGRFHFVLMQEIGQLTVTQVPEKAVGETLRAFCQ